MEELNLTGKVGANYCLRTVKPAAPVERSARGKRGSAGMVGPLKRLIIEIKEAGHIIQATWFVGEFNNSG